MELAENPDFDNATTENTDNENANSDSGTQILQENKDVSKIENHDEKSQIEEKSLHCSGVNETDANTDKIKDNNDDDKLESKIKVGVNEAAEKSDSIIEIEDKNTNEKLHTMEIEDSSVNKKLEKVTKDEVTKEDVTAILGLKPNFSRKYNSNENVSVNTYSLTNTPEESKTGTFIHQNTSTHDIKNSTVELKKAAEGRNSPEIVVEPKITERLQSGKITSQIIRVVTP